MRTIRLILIGVLVGLNVNALQVIATNYRVHNEDVKGMTVVDIGTSVSTFTSDAAYDPASLNGGASRTDSVAVTGLIAGRWTGCAPPSDITPSSCIYNCWSATNGIASVHWYNGDDGVGGSACNPGSSTWVFIQPAS